MAGMSSDVELLKDIPGYKAILKSVLKSQIQMLVEQLSEHTGEESMILTASIHDGTLSHQGSNTGRGFLDGRDEIKSQFLGFCLKSHHKKKSPDTRSSPYQRPQTSVQPGRTTPTQGPVKKVPRLQVQPVSLQRVLPGDNTAGSRPPDMQRAPAQVTYSDSGQEGSTGSVSVKLESGESGVTSDDTDNFPATSVSFPSSIHQSHTLTAGDVASENNESQNSTEDYNEHVSENDDSSTANTCIKIEPITENEMELEITGVEPSKIGSQSDSWSHGATSFGVTPSVGTVDASPFSEASDSSYTFMCSTCGKSFRRKNNLVEHEKRHSGDARFVCCGKKFYSLGHIKQHRCNVHNAEKSYICSLCGSAFPTNAELRRHVRREKKEFPYNCEVCGYGEQDISKMTDHMSKHSGERHHRCDVCDKTFRYRSGLSAHIRKKHNV